MKMTLAASLAAGSAPLKVNAATEVVSQQSVQNANENTGDISKNAESAEIILEEDESDCSDHIGRSGGTAESGIWF